MSFPVSDRMKGIVFIFIFYFPEISQGVKAGQWHAGRGHRIKVASGGNSVHSLLSRRLWLPETLAQNSQKNTKLLMTNKLGRATLRWNLQMCSLPVSRHKSLCSVQIELHYSFARQRYGSIFIRAGHG